MRILTSGGGRSLVQKLSGPNVASPWHLQTRNLTDIEHYKCVEYSHLHIWDAQSAKRKFLVKLEQMEREKAARAQSQNFKLEHPNNLKPVKIPDYIDRQPSQLLKVLASAVKRDPTAADYKFHDDPYLIPYNSLMKRDFLMSKDGGKKAARFIVDKHPELFLNNLIEAQPPIKAFMPKVIVSDKNASVGLLNSHIEGFDVTGTIQVYEALKRKKAKIDIETKQKLLELICYNNGAPEMEENYNEIAGVEKAHDNLWFEGNTAEQVYQDITGDSKATPENVAAANLAILCGMANHKKRKEAWIYYEMTKDIKVVSRYNAGIKCLPITSEDFFENWQPAKSILAEMAAEGVKPNEITLLNILSHIRLIGADDKDYSNSCKLALSTLAEFKLIGILPSLGAYKELMEIFITQSKRNYIISHIVDELESRMLCSGKSLLSSVVSAEDFKFFRTAMDKVAFRMKKLDIAYKVHDLLMKHQDHQVLLGDYANVNAYYRNLVIVVLHRESIDAAMELASSLIPHIWTPTDRFYKDVIHEVQVQSRYQHLPKIWMDLQVSNFCSIKRIASFEMMKIFSDAILQADLEALNLESLRDAFVRIANDIFSELSSTADYDRFPLQQNNYAAPLCNNALAIAIRYGDDQLAMKIVSFCRQEVMRLVGSLDGSSLEKVLDVMINNEEKNSAVDCVIFAAEQRLPESLSMAKRLSESFELDDVEKNQLNLLFVHEVEWTKLEMTNK